MSNINPKIICPETGIIFCDPVRIDKSEHIYERVMLAHWINSNQDTCPFGTPVAQNSRLTSDQDTKNQVNDFLKSYPNDWQSKIVKGYQDEQERWSKKNPGHDDSAFVNSILESFKQNAYNAQCQRMAMFILTLIGATGLALTLNHFFMWLIFTAMVYKIILSTISLLTLFSLSLWLSPPQSQLFKGLFPEAKSSAHKNLCEALSYIWNPQTDETATRYATLQIDEKTPLDEKTLLEIKKYCMAFAQLVLGCPQLYVFNISQDKPLPTVEQNGRQVTSLTPFSQSGPWDYMKFEENIKQLKYLKDNPSQLIFPNQIPFIIRPLQGFAGVVHGLTSALLNTQQPSMTGYAEKAHDPRVKHQENALGRT